MIWMSRVDYTSFLEKSIRDQRLTLRIQLALAIGVVALGIVGVTVAQVYSGKLIPVDQKWLLTLGGGFISTLSGFPIKQIADRRIKISALEFLKNAFRSLSDHDDALTSDEAARLIERFWKLMDSSTPSR